MIPRRRDHYDHTAVVGDTLHLSIQLDGHDALRYFDLRRDDGKVAGVKIHETHDGETTTHEATVAGAREVEHTFEATGRGEYRVRARVELADGQTVTVPTTDPVRVWVAAP